MVVTTVTEQLMVVSWAYCCAHDAVASAILTANMNVLLVSWIWHRLIEWFSVSETHAQTGFSIVSKIVVYGPRAVHSYAAVWDRRVMVVECVFVRDVRHCHRVCVTYEIGVSIVHPYSPA